MATSQTAEEVKAEHLARMGSDLGEVYHALWNDVVHLCSKWNEHVVLFGTNPGRIEVLNKAAPEFFGQIQALTFDDTLLHIARVTGPPRSAGKDNLTLRRLPALVEEVIRGEVERLVGAACKAAEFAHDWRNRRIAHTDLALAMDAAEPLLAASRKAVNESIHAITAVLNKLSEHYLKSEIAFGEIHSTQGALQLIYLLDDAVAVREERRNRIKAGTYTEADLKALKPRRQL